MTYYTGSYEPPIGGVSQQHASSRLPSQVERQVNMLSDVVMGVRRRGGFSVTKVPVQRDAENGAVELGYILPDARLGAIYVQINLTSSTMQLRVLEWDTDRGVPVGDVITTHTEAGTFDLDKAREYFDIVVVGDSIVVLDRSKVVGSSTEPISPNTAGWFYIQAGQFKFKYTIVVGGKTFEYTTDSVDPGTGLGDETKITPEYIAEKLLAEIDSIPGYTDISKHRVGA